ncbi:hypothetical protein TNCV_3895981 [Trichonephila clavipes]|nr:hypothetical protein TNCV_3895981 [Trichonephila clavipes]
MLTSIKYVAALDIELQQAFIQTTKEEYLEQERFHIYTDVSLMPDSCEKTGLCHTFSKAILKKISCDEEINLFLMLKWGFNCSELKGSPLRGVPGTSASGNSEHAGHTSHNTYCRTRVGNLVTVVCQNNLPI